MPFQSGISGNPGGRTRKGWIAEKKRISEARKSFQKLIEIRNELVLERKVIVDGEDRKSVEVVSSIKDLILCCDKIMDRAIGKPMQPIEGSFDSSVSIVDRSGVRALMQTTDGRQAAELVTKALLSRQLGGGGGVGDAAIPKSADGTNGTGHE